MPCFLLQLRLTLQHPSSAQAVAPAQFTLLHIAPVGRRCPLLRLMTEEAEEGGEEAAADAGEGWA